MQAIVTRALCDHCLDLPVAVPGTHPHAFMKNGETYVERHNAKWEGPFHCSVCQTIWLHRKNQWGGCEGFRLNP